MLMVTAPQDEPLVVGKVRGLVVVVGRSWPYLFALLGLALLNGRVLESTTLVKTAWTALLWLACLVVAATIHELGHVAAARLVGLGVRRLVIDVWGGHMTYVAVPLTPGKSVIVAVGGSVANLAAASLAYVASAIPELAPLMGPFLIVNAGLFLYTMLPGLPLDGGHVVGGVAWWLTGRRTDGLEVGGWAGRFVILAAGVLFVLVPPLLGGTMKRATDLVWIVPLVVLTWGWTTRIISMARTRRITDRILVREVARPAARVAAHARLDIIDAQFPQGSGVVVENEHGVPVGVLEVGTPSARPRDVATAGDVMNASPRRTWTVRADLDGGVSEAMELMYEQDVPVVAVITEAGRYGLIWRAELDALIDQRRGRRVLPLG